MANFRMTVNNFNQAKIRIGLARREALQEVGQYLKPKIQQDCPVDTGNLRASTDYRTVEEGTSKTVLHIGTNVEYALAVHEGTWKMRPRRYIYNTCIRSISNIKNIIEAKFRRLM